MFGKNSTFLTLKSEGENKNDSMNKMVRWFSLLTLQNPLISCDVLSNAGSTLSQGSKDKSYQVPFCVTIPIQTEFQRHLSTSVESAEQAEQG